MFHILRAEQYNHNILLWWFKLLNMVIKQNIVIFYLKQNIKIYILCVMIFRPFRPHVSTLIINWSISCWHNVSLWLEDGRWDKSFCKLLETSDRATSAMMEAGGVERRETRTGLNFILLVFFFFFSIVLSKSFVMCVLELQIQVLKTRQR